MKIKAINTIEDCFDGSSIKEIVLDQPIDKQLIQFLGRNNKMQYFESFARPFFKITCAGLYELKGVEGNRSIRITLIKNPEQSLDRFKDHLRSYADV